MSVFTLLFCGFNFANCLQQEINEAYGRADERREFVSETHDRIKPVLSVILIKMQEAIHAKKLYVFRNLDALFDDIVKQNELTTEAFILDSQDKLSNKEELSDEEIRFIIYLEAALDGRYLNNREIIKNLKSRNRINNLLGTRKWENDARKLSSLDPMVQTSVRELKDLKLRPEIISNPSLYTEIDAVDEQLKESPNKLMDKLYQTLLSSKSLNRKKFAENSTRHLLLEKCIELAQAGKYLVVNRDFVEDQKLPSRIQKPKARFATMYNNV